MSGPAAAERWRVVADGFSARVDGVVHHGRFCVMELEVVEPELFFRLHPRAADGFATGLLEMLNR